MNARFIPLIAACAAFACPAAATAADYGEPLELSTRAIDTRAGVQSDPHVDQGIVAYTNEESSSEINTFDLASNSGTAVPKANSDFDFLSDTNAGRVTFTRVTSDRSAIYLVDHGSAPVEVDPQPGSRRRGAAIGGDTIAWQDFGFGTPAGAAEITVYDVTTGSTTRLTDDVLLDKSAAVSPSGNVVVWTKCNVDGTDCHIWKATRSLTGWDVAAVTSGDGSDASPDTDGTSVVYDSTRAGERDIYAQPVGGGPERRLELPGAQANPNIDGGVVLFETFDAGATIANWDLAAWDLASGAAYRLTTTDVDETLNDVTEDQNRVFTVPYSANDDIFVLIFRLRDDRDPDGDGVATADDNCPSDANAAQTDADGDGLGDACDPDRDGDGVANESDNCADTINADQIDADRDGNGDACDSDRDGDGVANTADNCADTANADQADADRDGFGDLCDADRDGDGVADASDNCVSIPNAVQADLDSDGAGDACDSDRDGDGVANAGDNCGDVSNADQADSDHDGQGDACDTEKPAAQQMNDLIAEIIGLDVHGGTKNSLIAKLRNAIDALNVGDKATACSSLASFIQEATAQSGKKLPAGEAGELIDQVRAIRVTIGC